MIKYFIRTTGERTLHPSIERELGSDYTLLIDTEHNSGKAFIKQLLEINDYDSVLMEDDIILCKDFKKRVEEVISKYPNKMINFFTYPDRYFKSQFQYFFCYNQCHYFPKGLPKQIHDKIMELSLNYSSQELLLRRSLYSLKIRTLNYRPCLVQHIDNGSLMNHNPNFNRRSPYFIDYLDELGMDYKDVNNAEDQKKLFELMRSKFSK